MELEKTSENFEILLKIGDLEKIKLYLSGRPFLLNPANSSLKLPALHAAVISGHLSASKYLLDQGFNPNLQDDMGKTALGLAVEHSHYKIVKLLLNYSANPNIIEKSNL